MVARFPMLINDSARLRDAMDQFFGEPIFRTFATSPRSVGTFSIPVDVFATEGDVIVIAAAPGLGPDELEVTIDDNVLTLSGTIPNAAKSNEAEGATWYLHENGHGQFRRTVTLPVDVDADQAEATFANGVLRLRLPKAEAARPRQIKVRSVEPVEIGAETENVN